MDGAVAAGDERGSSDTIHVKLKTPTESSNFTVGGDCTVTQLKACVSERLGTTSEQLALVHSGTVLNESELMSQHKGADGLVHLCVVLRDVAPKTVQSEELTLVVGPSHGDLTPSPTSPLFLVEGRVGLDSATAAATAPSFFPALRRLMERRLLADPELMCGVLASPLVQSGLSSLSPQVTGQLVLSGPLTLQLLQTNQEVARLLDDPGFIAQMAELAQNPDTVQAVLTDADRALANEEPVQPKPVSISGDLLQRTNMEAQEHHLGPSQARGDRKVTSPSGESLQNMRPNGQTLDSSKFAAKPPADVTAAPIADPAPRNTAIDGMQTLLEQITSCPALMENLLSGPYVSSLLDTLSHNPDLAAQMLLGHPLLSGYPQLQQQIRQQLPVFLQQMQNPQLLSAMLNPRAMEALLQIQHGLQTLAIEAPALIPGSDPGSANPSPKPPSGTILENRSGGDTGVNTVTEQQQKEFVEQMLQMLANTNNQS